MGDEYRIAKLPNGISLVIDEGDGECVDDTAVGRIAGNCFWPNKNTCLHASTLKAIVKLLENRSPQGKAR